MKNFLIILLTILLLASLLNPDEDAHQDAAMERIEEYLEISGMRERIQAGTWGRTPIIGDLVEGTIEGSKYVITRKIITSRNYKLWSVTQLKTIEGVNVPIGIGVFGVVILFRHPSL